MEIALMVAFAVMILAASSIPYAVDAQPGDYETRTFVISDLNNPAILSEVSHPPCQYHRL
jgi:hypothetical protein